RGGVCDRQLSAGRAYAAPPGQTATVECCRAAAAARAAREGIEYAMTRIIRCIALLLLLLALAKIAPAHAQEQPLPDQVRGLAKHAEEGIDAAEHNRPELMRGEYAEIHAIWGAFEDRVGAQDATGYTDIEAALDT